MIEGQKEPAAGMRPGASLWADGVGRLSVRALQFLIVFAAVAVIAWLVSSQLIVSLPIVIATILTCALQPALNWLRARRFGRVGSTVTAFAGALLALLAAFFLIGLAIYHQAGELAEKAIEGVTRLQEWLGRFGILLNAERLEQVERTLGGETGNLGERALAGFATAGEIGAGLVLTLVLLFFFLLDGDRMWAFARGFIPTRHRERAHLAAAEGSRVLGRYVRGTTIIALFAAVVDTAVMLIMHAPLAIPLGALIFFGAFVPILGALVTGMLAALVTLVTLGPVPSLVLVIVVIIVNQIEHHILQPKVMGDTLGLHGVVILIALAIGAHTGGIAGAVVAVPLAAFGWAVAKALIDARGGLYAEDIADPPASGATPAADGSPDADGAPAADGAAVEPGAPGPAEGTPA